jgi:hypothetical protein
VGFVVFTAQFVRRKKIIKYGRHIKEETTNGSNKNKQHRSSRNDKNVQEKGAFRT